MSDSKSLLLRGPWTLEGQETREPKKYEHGLHSRQTAMKLEAMTNLAASVASLLSRGQVRTISQDSYPVAALLEDVVLLSELLHFRLGFTFAMCQLDHVRVNTSFNTEKISYKGQKTLKKQKHVEVDFALTAATAIAGVLRGRKHYPSEVQAAVVTL